MLREDLKSLEEGSEGDEDSCNLYRTYIGFKY